jgi:NAD(P)-dependent dehydrogenase (short-subunit alcohol dehydrogenase family)
MRQVAIITGGARGMGLATAKLLGTDHHVVLADLSQESLDGATAELRTLGIDAEGVVCDVTDRASVGALFAKAASVGTVRAVVHAAGISPQMGDPGAILRVNVFGSVHITEAALEVAREGFALVLVASMAGHSLPRLITPKRAFPLATTSPDQFLRKTIAAAHRIPGAPRSGLAYALSKAWVIWYAEDRAPAFGAKGARVLSVSPGSFDTAMGRLEIKSGAEAMLQVAALKRFGRPDEIAEVLAFCASERPGYLTGVDILVDGGTTSGVARNPRVRIPAPG